MIYYETIYFRKVGGDKKRICQLVMRDGELIALHKYTSVSSWREAIKILENRFAPCRVLQSADMLKVRRLVPTRLL